VDQHAGTIDHPAWSRFLNGLRLADTGAENYLPGLLSPGRRCGARTKLLAELINDLPDEPGSVGIRQAGARRLKGGIAQDLLDRREDREASHGTERV
jgi:hypothetical protein